MPIHGHEGTVMAKSLSLLRFALLLLILMMPAGGYTHAASKKQPATQSQAEKQPAAQTQTEKQPATQSQIETTILHVDKYGVYAPNLVFYWPPEMNKQKIAALTHAAEQLRNKKAVITYTSVAEIPKDKRPLLVDLVPAKEGSKPLKEDYAREEPGRDARAQFDVPKPPDAAQPPPAPSPPQGQPELRPLRDKYKLPDAGQPESGSKTSSLDRQNMRPAPGEQTPQPDTAAPRKAQPEATAPEQEIQEPVPTAPHSIAKEEVVALIRRILTLTAQKDMNSILPYYADRVNYYDRGIVDIDYIRRDMGYYFKNWDTIGCALDGDVVLIVTDQQDVRIVKFISIFSVRNSRKSISGKAENIWKIQRINNQLKIVEEKQRTLATEPRS